MKFISFDCETTGLLDNPDTVVWQMAGVVEDTAQKTPINDLPYFDIGIRWPNKGLVWEDVALAMNAEHYGQVMKRDRNNVYNMLSHVDKESNFNSIVGTVWYEDVSYWMERWLEKQGFDKRVLFAGKNVGSFDIPFCKRCGLMPGDKIRIHHRVIDPSMGFVIPSDIVPPTLDECMSRIPEEFYKSEGVEGLTMNHDALADSRCVILALRYLKSIGKINF